MALTEALGALGGLQGASNLLSSVGNFATNLYNTYQQNKANQQNLGFQKRSLLLNQLNTQNTWNREDNAVQRRVSDLKAAGLSPTLAAGSAASSSQAIRAEPQHSESPQFAGFDKVDFSNPVLSALATAQDYNYKQAQIGVTEEQKKLIRQQLLESQSRALVNQSKVLNLDANTAFTKRNTKYFDTKNILANAQLELWQQQRSLMQSQKTLNDWNAKFKEFDYNNRENDYLFNLTDKSFGQIPGFGNFAKGVIGGAILLEKAIEGLNKR